MPFQTIVTDTGQTKIADAISGGGTVVFTQAAVGDGGGAATNPQSSDTALVNETSARVGINEITADGNQITVEFIIPGDDGGYTIREAAVFDADGDMILVANVPDSAKPAPGDGGLKQYVCRMVVTVSDASVINVTVDDSTVTATREWVRGGFAPIVATLEALATDLSAVNVFQSTTYTAGLSDSVAISWRATGATNAGSAGTTDFANGKLYDSVGTEFEYANEIIYVDALGGEVQNALDYAGSFGFPKIVHCGDQDVTTTVTVPQNVHFTTGRVTYDGVDTDIPIVKMGDNAAGTTLTRTAKISFIRAKDESGLAGIVGFQIGNYVRTSSIENCVAEMSEPVDQSLGQVGFEIASWYIGAPGITNTGTYGNTIKSCLALFAHTGFRARTFGTKANELSGPQANGNWILDCHAFSCRARALHLSYGAQENIVDIRADTFPSQIGLGTRIDVIAVDGRYNKVHLVEEIGPRADTQYSVMIGDEAIYNEIDFSTQQIVTGAIDDSLSPAGKRAKNIIRQTGTALISKGRSGSESSEGFYAAVAAGQTQAAQKIWIAPAKCVVTYVAGRLNTTAPLGGDTRIYFAKNAAYATNNRLVWSASEAVSVKSITTDTSAGTDIGTRWVLDPGDFITMAVDTPGGGGVTVTGTMFVRYI